MPKMGICSCAGKVTSTFVQFHFRRRISAALHFTTLACIPPPASLQELDHLLHLLDAHAHALPADHSTRGKVVSVVQACADLRGVSHCKRLHDLVDRIGLGRDVFVGNLIVSMYIRCGMVEEARSLFDSITARDLVLWTGMLSAYARKGDPEAFVLFRRMQLDGVKPDAVTLVAVLNACAAFSDVLLSEGRHLHAWTVELGLVSTNPFVGTALVNMYGRSGDVDQAHKVFREMSTRDPVPWNAMITAFAANGHFGNALRLLWEMLLESVLPTATTFVTVLNACTALRHGRYVHERALELGHDTDVIVATALLNMYGKFAGKQDHAETIFSSMKERNVVTWNAMIVMYTHNNKVEEAVGVFRVMQVEGVKPSEATFLAGLAACGVLPQLHTLARQLHELSCESGFGRSLLVSTALVDTYSKLGKLTEAVRVFEGARYKDVVLWNTMVTGYVQAGDNVKALEVFHRMQTEGTAPDYMSFLTVLGACWFSPEALEVGKSIHARVSMFGLEEDVCMGTALVNMYGKCGSLGEAREVFDRMKDRSLITWNAMIGAYVHKNDGDRGLNVFRNMLSEGAKPDRVTFLSILSACAGVGSLVTGRKVHDWLTESGLPMDSMLENGLLNMYYKTGGLESTRSMFSRIQRQDDPASWNTIISACSSQGKGHEALKLLLKMQQEGVRPKGVTFMSVLSGCSHAGLLWEGVQCFSSMICDHGLEVTEEHCGCVIDLLARAGKVRDAHDLISRMPSSHSNSVLWMSLLGACKVQGDLSRGKLAAEKVIETDPWHHGAYVALQRW